MIAALIVASALQPLPATALDDPLETACHASSRSINAKERCEVEALRRAEDNMAFYWRNTLAEYGKDNPRSTSLLKKAQADWLNYRRAWCDVVARDNHGSNPSSSSACMLKLTRQRTQAILELIQGTNE